MASSSKVNVPAVVAGVFVVVLVIVYLVRALPKKPCSAQKPPKRAEEKKNDGMGPLPFNRVSVMATKASESGPIPWYGFDGSTTPRGVSTKVQQRLPMPPNLDNIRPEDLMPSKTKWASDDQYEVFNPMTNDPISAILDHEQPRMSNNDKHWSSRVGPDVRGYYEDVSIDGNVIQKVMPEMLFARPANVPDRVMTFSQ